MSVQYYRKFARYREERTPGITVMAEFVVPCTTFHGDVTDFTIKLIRICKRAKDSHFVVKEGLYKLDPATKRFNRLRNDSFDRILHICTRYSWLLEPKIFSKVAKAGLVIPLIKSNEKEKLQLVLDEIKGCAACALL